MLSVGLRYEAQTHVADYNNLGPRAGMTWAPFKSGQHDAAREPAACSTTGSTRGVYEQTLRVDGVRQQEVIIVDQSVVSRSRATGGTVPPVNRYQLEPGLAAAAQRAAQRRHRSGAHAEASG